MVKNEWDLVKKFKGEWVAVWNNKLVGHGKTLHDAYNQALKVCSSPRVYQVPDNEDEVYLL